MAERGENCLIVAAGGVTPVTNAIIAGILDEVGKGESFAEVYGAPHGVGGLVEGRIADLGAQKRKTIEALRRTPGSVLSGRVKEGFEASALIPLLRSQDIGTLFLLGGLPMVGLMRAFTQATQEAGLDIQILGVPCSAENEVAAGDHTPGYGSSARFVATAARDAGRGADAGDEPVVVLEVPGAQGGWLAASSALARDREGTRENSAPHAIILPERAADPELVVDEVRRAYIKHGFALAVTTEASKSTDGSVLDGAALAALLGDKIGVATRYDRPGSLVRLSHSSVARADAEEAYNLGSLGVRLAGDDCSGYYVLIQRDNHASDKGEKGYRALDATARLDQVEGAARVFPAEYIAENGLNVTSAFTDWARPLVGGALPEYASLSAE
jgi:6-phosphofructokinase 1